MLKTLGKITIFTVLFLTLSLGLFLIALYSIDDAVTYEPYLLISEFDIASVSATALYVVDVETKKEIVSKNKDTVLPIASITKLVTAALFYSDTDLEATTSILWSDVANEGEAGKLTFGDVYTHRELMYPLLLESSNDAAFAVERVEPLLLDSMNAYAKSLGLKDTLFVDTSGLSSKNIGTADQLSTLGLDLYKTVPHIFDITRLTQFLGTNTGWRNNNPLVGEEGYRGGKHGFTPEANRTAVAFFNETLASGQIRTFGYVVLGSENIQTDIALLRTQVQQNVILE